MKKFFLNLINKIKNTSKQTKVDFELPTADPNLNTDISGWDVKTAKSTKEMFPDDATPPDLPKINNL